MSTPSLSVVAPANAPSTPLVLAMAAGAGFSVASLYYSQPMLGLIAQDLGAGERAAGLVPEPEERSGAPAGAALRVVLDDQLARHRLTHADIRQTLRSSGIGDLGEAVAVILESDGSRSVITGSQLGNGSVLDDVPGWPRRDAD